MQYEAMKLDCPSTASTVPSYRKRVPVMAVKPRQKMTVEMPMMIPGVSTGATTTR